MKNTILLLAFAFLFSINLMAQNEKEQATKKTNIEQQAPKKHLPPHLTSRKDKDSLEKGGGGGTDIHFDVDNNDKIFSGYFNNSATGLGETYGVYISNTKADADNSNYGIYSLVYNDDSSSPVNSPNYAGYFINNSWGNNDAYAGYFNGSFISNVPIGYGIYARASGATENWAGYFEGRVNITGITNIQDTLTTSANVYMQDTLSIGTTTPATEFHLAGEATIEAPSARLNFVDPFSGPTFQLSAEGSTFSLRDDGTYKFGYYGPDEFGPTTNDNMTLGSSSFRWSEVWSVNGLNMTSDRRLKKNIVSLSYGLTDLLEIRPVSYEWKKGKKGTRIGFIAQEVEEIIPEVVQHIVLSDEEIQTYESQGRVVDQTDNYSIDYISLIPLLVKGIQEQQVIIKKGQAENAALKTRLAKLEAAVEALSKE